MEESCTTSIQLLNNNNVSGFFNNNNVSGFINNNSVMIPRPASSVYNNNPTNVNASVKVNTAAL